MSSFGLATLPFQSTSLRMVRGSIATTPFPAVCGPTTMTLPLMTIHPSSAAADRRAGLLLCGALHTTCFPIRSATAFCTKYIITNVTIVVPTTT